MRTTWVRTYWIVFLILSHFSMQIKGFSNCCMSTSHVFLWIQFHLSNFPTFLNFSLKPSWWSYRISDQHISPDIHRVSSGSCLESTILASSCSPGHALARGNQGVPYKRNDRWFLAHDILCCWSAVFCTIARKPGPAVWGSFWIPGKTLLLVSGWLLVFPGPKAHLSSP